MSTVNFARMTTDELLRSFAETAKRAGTIFSEDKSKLLNPQRRTLVPEMQALGAELGRRRPIEKLRQLFEDDDPDVRGWAGPQFLSVDPDWATATFTGLCYNLSTREVLAWRDRILRRAPKRPRLDEMTVPQLVDRFVDACERCYGSTRFLTDEQGGGPSMKAHNKVAGDIYAAAKELNRRGELRALVPLFKHPLITVRQRAARYCLPVATERAIATLEKVAATKELPESSSASWTLDLWRKGQYCAFPDDLKDVRV
ncbi:MAG: DUF2019 domain-containing protein [Xanthobacteraceae bacterium]|jgi:hypothetical protein